MLPGIANAQLLSTETHMADSLRKEFDSGPYFTLYKDNYFLVGSE
jgi:hypothetical protein